MNVLSDENSKAMSKKMLEKDGVYKFAKKIRLAECSIFLMLKQKNSFLK